MKFNKKLLAALLPITAASTLAPVLSSCGGSGYTINYLDEVNCLDEKAKNYHSLKDVQNSIKQRASVESIPTISMSDLPKWTTGTAIEKQKMYYDLVAGYSIMSEIKFDLTYDKTVGSFKLIYLDKTGSKQTLTGTSLEYVRGTEKANEIYIQIAGTAHSVKSYQFKDTKIV